MCLLSLDHAIRRVIRVFLGLKSMGCVAKLKVSTQRLGCFQRLRRGGETEEAVDERNLPGDVALRQPPHLTFPNHVYRLDTLNRPPCRVKRSESLHGSDSTFDCPVVLLHYIV